MREWNSYSDDITIDGNEVKEYTIRFKTTEYEVYKRIEKFFQRLIDESNCSEKPNNSTISKMEQVDYDCKSCKHDLWHTPRMCGKCVRQEDGKPSMYEPKTEPQKCYLRESCDHYGDKQMCGRCREYNLYSHTKDEPQTDEEYINNLPWTEAGNGEQTDIEIARAIVHKAIDDTVIAEDAYPDLRQKMHDAVDNYEPQTDCAWKKGE